MAHWLTDPFPVAYVQLKVLWSQNVTEYHCISPYHCSPYPSWNSTNSTKCFSFSHSTAVTWKLKGFRPVHYLAEVQLCSKINDVESINPQYLLSAEGAESSLFWAQGALKSNRSGGGAWQSNFNSWNTSDVTVDAEESYFPAVLMPQMKHITRNPPEVHRIKVLQPKVPLCYQFLCSDRPPHSPRGNQGSFSRVAQALWKRTEIRQSQTFSQSYWKQHGRCLKEHRKGYNMVHSAPWENATHTGFKNVQVYTYYDLTQTNEFIASLGIYKAENVEKVG